MMKTTGVVCLNFLVFFFGTTQAFCQNETFDIIQYKQPAGWKKQTPGGVVIFTHTDSIKNAFCMIALYASSKSSSKPQQDFTAEWNELAIHTFNADSTAIPKTQVQTTGEGWKVISAATSVIADSIESYLVLTVFSGFGKKISVLSNFNDTSYLAVIDGFLDGMTLDKKGVPSQTKKSTKEQSANTLRNTTGSDPGDETSQRFGHMLYPPLKGWKQEKYSNAVVFIPSDLLPGQMLEVRILESKPFAGSLQEALAESWNDAMQQLQLQPAYSGKLYDVLTERKSFKGWDYIKGRGTLKNDIDKYDTYLFVIKLNNRIERMLVVGFMNISFGSFSPYSNPVYEQAINELFFSVKFDDWKESRLQKGSPKGEGIVGLYEGLKLSGGRLNGAYTLFFSNGQVYSAPKFPPDGFYGANTLIEAEVRPGYWGSYSLKNGKGFIQMGSGDIPIKASGNDLVVTTQNTDHKYEKLPSVDGATFNGTYVFDGKWDGHPPSVTFTRDGRFTDNGALDILHHTTTDFFNPTKDHGNGTYEVKDFTIVFHYSDGRNISLVFIGEGYDKKNPSPATLTLTFNHDTIYRE